ncbi:hypothetical protein [Microbacterium trichothecenolyticum]|uniref:Uncharacterized protein n=1 Tax=Microbacterium trichothecenolyticum TaxID=69370 RepID=A0A0M2HG33_MICTR|nr:hypothetical protein [Microbacterium trichothecenolyticum]KJL45611.1 hypothetical protein RS82_00163 [Microbacterium trichothecenolyticum]
MTTATTSSRRVHAEFTRTETINVVAPTPDIPELRPAPMPTAAALFITIVPVVAIASSVAMIVAYALGGQW